MGAEAFETVATGETPASAFREAKNRALYDYGHAGYTGTIAEKPGFVEVPVPPGQDAKQYAAMLADDSSNPFYEQYNDKWGDCLCVKVSEDSWLFFGWASS